MRKHFKRISAVILTFVLLVSVSPYFETNADNSTAYASTTYRYGRSLLDNSSQKYIYDTLKKALENKKSVCSFDYKKYKVSEKNFNTACFALWKDYPEFGYWNYSEIKYWYTGNVSNKTIVKTEISYYTEFKSKSSEYNLRCKSIVKSIPKDCDTDLEKAKYLYDTVMDITVYPEFREDEPTFSAIEHSSYGAILNGSAVCEGYARAYQDLCLRAGIQCWIVDGYMALTDDYNRNIITNYKEKDGKTYGGHAWNVIWLDGKCYYTDATSDDQPVRTYAYFLKDETSLKENYILGDSTYNGFMDDFIEKSYPVCNDGVINANSCNVEITEPLGTNTVNIIASSFGETKYGVDYHDGEYKYQRYTCIKYTGEKNLKSWLKDNMWEITSNAGINGEKEYSIVEDGDFTHLTIMGSSTSNEIAETALDEPILTVIKNTSKKKNTLKWYGVEDAESYEIYRKVNKVSFKLLTTTDDLTYVDSKLKKGTYYYKIKAVKGETKSGYSVSQSSKIS